MRTEGGGQWEPLRVVHRTVTSPRHLGKSQIRAFAQGSGMQATASALDASGDGGGEKKVVQLKRHS